MRLFFFFVNDHCCLDVSNSLKNANQRKLEKNFNEFRVYMDQKVLAEKHIKGKTKDL